MCHCVKPEQQSPFLQSRLRRSDMTCCYISCDMLPVMLDTVSALPRTRRTSAWKAVWLPHSAGKLPDSSVSPSKRVSSEGRDPFCAQDAGRVPVSGVTCSSRVVSLGKDPVAPQPAGNGPEHTSCSPSEKQHCCPKQMTLQKACTWRFAICNCS